MEFPKPGFNLREAIDQINAGDDLSRLPDEELVISERAQIPEPNLKTRCRKEGFGCDISTSGSSQNILIAFSKQNMLLEAVNITPRCHF